VAILDYTSYEKEEAIRTLNRELAWRPHEKKHCESVFTRFYQGYILPETFNFDKRKVHYSTLVCLGQMSRAQALELMNEGTYEDTRLLEEDKEYVLKKLTFTEVEFEKYLESPAVQHQQYASNGWIFRQLVPMKRARMKRGIRLQLFHNRATSD